MCHVSTKEALADILAAKARGVRVTCEVTPHHIWFWDSDFRVNPPIRAKEDVEALIAAILRGEVEAIATDHAPHTEEDKRGGAPGMVGWRQRSASATPNCAGNTGCRWQT